MVRDIDTKVIGCFSYKSKTEVTCDGDACIISGSEKSMRDYLLSMSKEAHDKSIIKKTRFGEIIRGLKRGGAYAFDEESYNRELLSNLVFGHQIKQRSDRLILLQDHL